MSEQSSRQVLVTAPGVVEIHESPLPVPDAGEILVRMRAVGICGSDVHAFHGRHPFIPFPYHPGHEVLGTVEAAAADVSLPVGTRVVIEPILACRNCKYCLDGRYNLCTTISFFGCSAPTGGMADFFTIPADRAVPVPAELDDRQAVLIEPLATPVHAVELSGGDLRGKNVAILGAGTIGLLTLAAARRKGATRITVSDVSPEKRDLAIKLGADSAFDASTPNLVETMRMDLGTSADIVFDCVAIQGTVDQAVKLALKGGTVVIVGVPAHPVTIPLPEIQDMQVRIQGSATYTRADYDQAIALISEGAVCPDDFITAAYPLSEVAAGLKDASSGKQVKVIITADGHPASSAPPTTRQG